MDEDLDDYFNLEEFAVQVTYTRSIYPHPSSKTKKIDGIPGYGYVESGKVHGYHTTCMIKAANCSAIAEGDYLKMEDTEYTVIDWEYDVTKTLITLVLQTV